MISIPMFARSVGLNVADIGTLAIPNACHATWRESRQQPLGGYRARSVHQPWDSRMKKSLAVAVVALSFAPSCVLAQECAGDAALGALSRSCRSGAGRSCGRRGDRLHCWTLHFPLVGDERTPTARRPALAEAIRVDGLQRGARSKRQKVSTCSTACHNREGAATRGSSSRASATGKPVPATSLGPEAENSMPPVQTLE